MDSDSVKKNFQTGDFVSFGVILSLSCAIGIYFDYKDRKNTSTDTYFFCGRTMHPVAVGLSMAATFASAVGFIADPAECYIIGDVWLWNYGLRILPAIPAILYFVPAFHRLSVRTTFEFLELRFNAKLRWTAAAIRILGSIFHAGIVVYVPATALNAVTPLPLSWSIVFTSVVCTFYTTLVGGMKAVIWTDVLKFIFMTVGLAALLIQGLIAIGGFQNLALVMERGQRYSALRFDYGVISRVSPLATLFGSFTQFLYFTALSPQFVQRFLTCKTVRQAQWAVFVYSIPVTIMGLALLAIGLVMYAFYEGCDPVLSGQIASIDQAIPYMALELFSNLPGMAGLFIASVFSAAMSTVSSILNPFAIVIVEDMLTPCWKRLSQSERLKVLVGKVSVIVLGVLLMVIAFTASLSRSNVVQLLIGFTGIISGPLVGVFILGFFFPWTNSLGATIGLVVSFAFGAFMFIGNEFLKIPYPTDVPPRYTSECYANNTTEQLLNIPTTRPTLLSTSADIHRTSTQDFYNLNFHIFPFIGMVASIIVGIVASLISGASKPSEADPKLFIPLIDNKCFPAKVRRFFRFGVRELKTDQEIDTTTEENRL